MTATEEKAHRLRPYPSYKDSGVEWIGEIPEGWEVKRLASYISRRSETNRPDETLLSVYRDYGVIQRDSRSDNFNKPSEDLSNYRFVKAGNLVVNKMKAWQGSLGVSEFDGIVSPAYFVFDLKDKINGRFTHHMLRCNAFAKYFEINSSGVRVGQWDLPHERLRNTPILIPPLSEQQAIAAFLDRETARIDELMREQEALLDDLSDKRQATLLQATTKGIGNTPTKPSGLVWESDIPSHWETVKLTSVARLESGHTPSRSVPEYWENCTIPWVSLSDVRQFRDGRLNQIFVTEEMVSELGIANSSARILPAGTVILSRTASVGFSTILGTAMATTQDFANWICGPRLLPEFLLHVLRGMRHEFRRLMMGSTHQTIYMPDIRAFQIPLPPIDEQQAIIRHLGQVLTQIDQLVDEVRANIEDMRIHRSALITAAVTGKIDVRPENE